MPAVTATICDYYHLIESLRQVASWRKVVALLLSPCVIRAGVASAHAALHWQHVQHCTSIICMQHRTGSMCVCVQHRTGSMCVCAASYRQLSASLHSPLILLAFSPHSLGCMCRQHLHAASHGHLLRAASYRQTRMAAWYGQHLPLVSGSVLR